MVGRIVVVEVSPVVDLGQHPAKATVGEPLPVRATIFREGHDQLAAEVIAVDPAGTRRAPIRMRAMPDLPDRYEAWLTPDVQGAWSFEIHAWSDPIGTWQHDAALKIPAGVDVELMFTEACLLFERVRTESVLNTTEDNVIGWALEAAGDQSRPRRRAIHPPTARTRLDAWPVLAVRRSATCLGRQLVRVLPEVRGCHDGPQDRTHHLRQLPNRC